VVDSHCHLADEAFEPDLDEVVERARAVGVVQGLCVLAAGDAAEAARADRLASVWPEIRFAVGVHPHEAARFADDRKAALETVRAAIAANPRVRALGEIGLDYHYDFSPRSVQLEIFADQVGLARELRMPVVIHTREATADTLAVLREAGGGEVTGVFHCFSGDAGMAREALDLGFAVSFAGIVTFPRAEALRAAAALIPPDRLLVETDAPYLAPVPHRGSRNEPAHVVRVAEAVARARGESFEAVARAAAATFEALFSP
jgi:TatD DNase family protein